MDNPYRHGYLYVEWDRPQAQMDGGYNPEDFDLLHLSVADLIAEKEQVIKQCEASITAARAEIIRLTAPNVGETVMSIANGNSYVIKFIDTDGTLFTRRRETNNWDNGSAVVWQPNALFNGTLKRG